MSEKLKIQVVVGSVREGRVSLPVAHWVRACAGEQGDLDAELVDLADWALPMFALATPPAMGGYKDPRQQRWAAKVGEAGGYILVSPEYNHGTSAVLKNALDYLYAEWNRKPVAFVSFGNTGGARAVEQLRAIAVELRMAPLGEAVHLLGVADKLRDGRFEADATDKKQLARLFDSLTWWGNALQTARLGDAIAPNGPQSVRKSGA
jgi:NAD(P)H-dependent FMN reductase